MEHVSIAGANLDSIEWGSEQAIIQTTTSLNVWTSQDATFLASKLPLPAFDRGREIDLITAFVPYRSLHTCILSKLGRHVLLRVAIIISAKIGLIIHDGRLSFLPPHHVNRVFLNGPPSRQFTALYLWCVVRCSFVLYLTDCDSGLSLLGHCISRRFLLEDINSWGSIRQIAWPRLCILLLFVDSWLFLASSGL